MRVLSLACALMVITATRSQLPAASLDSPSFLYTRAAKYDALAWLHGEDRFPRGARLFVDDGGRGRALLPTFVASADPAVSFDGQSLLFAGKEVARDHWQIWEMQLSNGALRRLTSCPGNCIRPLYLPENRFVFAEQSREGAVLKAGYLQGGPSLLLTYAPGYALPGDVLHDGRILFDFGPIGTARPEIYTVYSDGSGVESYRCDHGQARHSGRQLVSGDVVFAHEQELARFTSAVAHEISASLPARQYTGDVVELPGGDWLLAYRSEAGERFQIARWSPGTQRLKAIVFDEHADVLQPAVITARPVPNRHPSALHDWNYANLLCLDAYTSKLDIAPGTIATVRLYTRDAAHEILLGSSSVEKDGSFYLRTPADRPLKIELVNAAGETLQKEAGWFWLRRGEQRICVGCHAGPETAPENAVPAVLLHSTIATDMTGARTATGGH